jgi:DNA-binding transcriptional regulator YdaS (Cro superfamily)
MNIGNYLQSAPRGTGARIARDIGVNPVMVSQWVSGLKAVPAERCVDIEIATDRAVMRWDLRPADWYRIWPELIGTEGAPAVPTPADEVRDAA